MGLELVNLNIIIADGTEHLVFITDVILKVDEIDITLYVAVMAFVAGGYS